MADCKTCKSYVGKEHTICEDCTRYLGFSTPIPIAAPRLTGCAKCEGKTLVRAVLRERTLATFQRDTADLAPVAAAFGMERSSVLFGFGGGTPRGNVAKPFGCMEAWICRACGYTEIFTQAPETIPIGPEFGTEMIEVAESEPYR